MTETIDPGAPTGRETVPTSVRMPQSLLDQLDAMAEHRKLSRAGLIVRIVENMLRLREAAILPDGQGNLVKYKTPCPHTTQVKGICGECGSRNEQGSTEIPQEVDKIRPLMRGPDVCPQCGFTLTVVSGGRKCSNKTCNYTRKTS